MPATVRRQLAESYPRLLLFAKKARELGLDQDPRFAETMRFASMQLLTQRLNRYFEEQANSISDSDVEEYYKENAIKFERAELLRIIVPKQTRQAQKSASGGAVQYRRFSNAEGSGEDPGPGCRWRRLPATPAGSF